MILACCINITPASAEPTGSGTELDPYLITSESDLRLVTGASDACWRLENDIELTQRFTLAEFSGTLDGNGHKISNISLSSSEGYNENEAAFILENTGTIKDLHVEGTVNYSSSNPGGAVFVYKNSGTIEGCSVKGTMNVTLLNTHSQNGSSAGAFAAYNESGGVIRNCYSRVYMCLTVSGGSSSKMAGTSGFVNTNDGYIENCYAATYGRTASVPYSGFRTSSGDGAHSDSCTVTVYEPEPLDYSVNSVTVANGGSKLRAEVSVTKNSDTTDGVVIIGLYDSTGALSDYIFIDGDLDRDKTYTLGGTLPSEPGGTVKAFVWDSLDSMQPISNSAEQRL